MLLSQCPEIKTDKSNRSKHDCKHGNLQERWEGVAKVSSIVAAQDEYCLNNLAIPCA